MAGPDSTTAAVADRPKVPTQRVGTGTAARGAPQPAVAAPQLAVAAPEPAVAAPSVEAGGGTGPEDRGAGGTATALAGATGVDALACLGFVLLAYWVLHRLWADPAGLALALNPADQTLNEWFLALGPRVWHGDVGLVTHLLNAPDGVNLLSNTSLLAYGTLLAPVTAMFGVPVTFVLALTLNLAGTAAGWYLLLVRGLGIHRLAGAAGALLCGFGPGIVSQSNGHVHMAAQWLVPLLVYTVLRLGRAAGLPVTAGLWRCLAWGALLGLLVAVQVFIGEEVLFLTALTLALFFLGYVLRVPTMARRAGLFGAGLATGGLVALLLLAHPLAVQFTGAQHVPGSPFPAAYYHADLATFPALSPLSLAGAPVSGELSTGPAEYTSYLGWPLMLVTAALVVWQRRRPVVPAAAFAATVMCWLSLGPTPMRDGMPSAVPPLYPLLARLPVVGAALPSRFALAALPLIGLILAVGLGAALRAGGRIGSTVVLASGVALVPLLPVALPAQPRAPVPRFITSGAWRDCVRPGGVLVPVPLPTPGQPDAMRWASATDDAFALPEGFFIGPYGAGGTASMGTYKQATSQLLADVASTGAVPVITQDQRRTARSDLRFWHASCVAVAPGPHADAVRRTVADLLGEPGRQAADTWVWRLAAG